MSQTPKTIHSDPNSLTPSALETGIDGLRSALRQRLPQELAHLTGAAYQAAVPEQGEFCIDYYEMPVRITFPELIAYQQPGQPLPLPVQALLLYHFTASDGTPLTGKWVAFNDLLDGRVYAQAFQGYAGDKLSRAFGNQIEPFQQACLAAGGRPAAFGDAAFSFSPLPRVPVLVTYWLGEDEFPPSAKILFDASARNYLPIDVCAIMGSMLVSKILKASKTGQKPAAG